MNLRTVTVEFLRAGPRHNQLLSPLTQYLAICGDASAGRVTLPYEHRDLELRLQELNYGVSAADDPSRRERVLERTGDEIAEILSIVPGFSGALNSETERANTLTQLRIVLSASELAMLPFELSKVPAGAGSSGAWLALQARVPVCITRHIRSVSAEGLRWPMSPRVLFVAGPDTPVDRHRRALEKAAAPWRAADDGVGHCLAVVERATLSDISDHVTRAAQEGTPFSHVHILAHGARLDEHDPYSPVGVALHGEVVSGRRLATALSAVTPDRVVRPAVVTLATCESASVKDVRAPEASVAHDLHDQGIPLVVASQFPLTIEGSVPFVDRFYSGQLKGEHPLISLYDVRLMLHGRMGQQAHDWAAIVVYEAFPSDLPAQLDELRYWQARRAQEGTLRRVEAFVRRLGEARPGASGGQVAPTSPAGDRTRLDDLVADARGSGAGLPDSGAYALECRGLRAAGLKRLGEAAFRTAVLPEVAEDWRKDLFEQCARRLDEARAEYWRAAKAFLGPTSELARRKANLHWLLGQVVSLDVVLGRPFHLTMWTAARLSAQIDTESADEEARAWAHVSLSELLLLRLADEAMPSGERADCADQAFEEAARVVEVAGRTSEHVATTARQFDRYVSLWGNPQLAASLQRLGLPSRQHWHVPHGLVPTARRILDVLRGSGGVMAGGPETGAPPTPSSSGGPATGVQPAGPKAGDAAERSSTRLSRAARADSLFAIEMLPAENGDCLWIEYGDPREPHRILIDCGTAGAAGIVESRMRADDRPLALFVLTHIDADHVDGVLPLVEGGALDGRCEDVWFNGWRQVSRFLGVKQGEAFSAMLADPARRLPWNRLMSAQAGAHPAPVVIQHDAPLPAFELSGGMRVTLLSPGVPELVRLGREWRRVLEDLKPGEAMLGARPQPPPVTDLASLDLESLAATRARKDTSAANGSSIALLAEFDGRAALFTGDAHAEVLASSIRRLQRERGREGERLALDALKLSHHGSANATTVPLLEQVTCSRYLVSTSGIIFWHPDREALARVVVRGGPAPTLLFNYRSQWNALWGEPVLRERYGHSTVFPEGDRIGLRAEL